MKNKSDLKLHDATVFWGTLLGFVLGSIVWLFRVQKRGEDTRQDIIQTGRDIVERDPLKDSLIEGKSLAKEHRQKMLD